MSIIFAFTLDGAKLLYMIGLFYLKSGRVIKVEELTQEGL